MSINFLPTSHGQKLGTLSLKIPGFRNSRGNAVKSSIPLRGFAGQPQLQFSAQNLIESKLTLYEMSNDVATVKKILIENTGNSAGFYSVQAFDDAECKSESNWETGPIRLENRYGHLEPGQKTQLLLRIDPEIVDSRDVPKHFGTLSVTWGSELARKILTCHKKISIPGAAAQVHNLDDIKKNFPILHEVDVKQCLGVIFKKVIQIYGARNHESFYALPTEETLSESMMMNNSVAVGQHEKFHQTFTTIGQVSR